jgi:hypothetical protein
VNRAPLIFRAGDVVMVGTVHVPARDAGAQRDRIGLLLLNGGPVPRAGSGDLAAYLCDRLGELGVMGFRFDVQGLGDASGPSWRLGDEFWRAGQRGHNDAAIASLVKDLCQKYSLRGMLIGGLCAGGILGLRAVAGLRSQALGLVLLEPNMRASEPLTRRDRLRSLVLRLRSFDDVLAMLTGKSRYARLFKPLQPWLTAMAARRTGPKLPGGVDRGIAARWRRLTCADVPTLLVVAADSEVDRYTGSVLETFPSAKQDGVRVARVPDSNHILLPENSRQKTADALCTWVAEIFPQAVART